MNNTNVKISGIEIEDFKNVEYGYLRFENPEETDKKCQENTLESFSQDKAEKGVLVNAIELLKIILSGESIPSYFADYVSIGKTNAVIKYEFEIQDNSDSNICYALYKISLHRNNSDSAIFDETLLYSREHDDLAGAKDHETIFSYAVSHSSIFSDRFTDRLRQNFADSRCRFIIESLKEFGRREYTIVSTANTDILLIPSLRLQQSAKFLSSSKNNS